MSNFTSLKFFSVKQKFARIAKKLIYIGSFNIQLLKLFEFTSHLLHIWITAAESFWDYFFVLASNRFSKKLNSFRSSHQKVFYKMELHSSKSCKIAGFQALVSAAMWTILHVAGILDSPLDLNIGITMVTLISVLFLFTKFILIFQLKY